MCKECAKLDRSVTAIEAHSAELIETLMAIDKAANPTLHAELDETRREDGPPIMALAFAPYVIGYLIGRNSPTPAMATRTISMLVNGINAATMHKMGREG